MKLPHPASAVDDLTDRQGAKDKHGDSSKSLVKTVAKSEVGIFHAGNYGSHEQHSLSLDKITPDIIEEILSEKKSSLEILSEKKSSLEILSEKKSSLEILSEKKSSLEILSEKKSSLDSQGRRPQVIGQDNEHLNITGCRKQGNRETSGAVLVPKESKKDAQRQVLDLLRICQQHTPYHPSVITQNTLLQQMHKRIQQPHLPRKILIPTFSL